MKGNKREKFISVFVLCVFMCVNVARTSGLPADTDVRGLRKAAGLVSKANHQGIPVLVYDFLTHDKARAIYREQHAAEEQLKVGRITRRR